MPCSYYTEAEERDIERRELDEVTRLLCSVMKLKPFYYDPKTNKAYDILGGDLVEGLGKWVEDHTKRDLDRRRYENVKHYKTTYPTLTDEQIMTNVDLGIFDDISADKEFFSRVSSILSRLND